MDYILFDTPLNINTAKDNEHVNCLLLWNITNTGFVQKYETPSRIIFNNLEFLNSVP